MKKNFFRTYKFKFLFFIVFFMFLTCTSLIIMAVRDTKNTSISIFSERGNTILKQAISQIDIDQYKRISASLDKNDPYFDELYKTFNSIKTNTDCLYLYTMRPISGNNFAYVIDGTDQSDEENYSEIGTIENIEDWAEQPLQCMQEQQIVYSGLEDNEDWGWMISIYAPIIDEDGISIGFVGVDFTIDELKNHIANTKNKLTMIGIIISGIGIIFMIFVILSFFKKLNSVVDAMKNVSDGAKNLSVRLDVPKTPELGTLSLSCNAVISSMQLTMQTVSKSVESVNKNSTKILDHTRKLLDLITNVNGNMDDVQSKATSQTNLIASLETNINDLEDSIQTLNTKISEQNRTVSSSIREIETIINSINGTDSQINFISQEYQSIVEETKTNEKKQNNMTEKIRFIEKQASNLSTANAVITGIASKTNLLAMNAAIEASHAGEAGKGFSVVAGEIRALAENSAKQTQNITTLVTNIEEAVKQIVIASDDSEKAFSALGHKIETLSSSMISIKQNMNEQNENATNVTAMLGLLADSAESITLASNTITEKTNSVVKGINTMKFSIKRINETSTSAKSLLSEMTSFAHDTNESSESNQGAVDDINELINSYKF